MAPILIPAMMHADSPMLYLAAMPSTKRSSRSRIHFLDYAFLTTVLVIIAGGCLWMLDMGSAHSTGHQSITSGMVGQAQVWLPAIFGGVMKYALLLIASIVNSALIVGLVVSLRSLDRRVNQVSAKRRLSFARDTEGKAINVRRPRPNVKVQARESSPFLLSPVFR